MHHYVIIEHKQKTDDGLVPHTVTCNGKTLQDGLSYDESRSLVESHLAKDDTVTEDYKSSRRKVHCTFDKFMAEQKSTRDWLASH